ncbi:Phosphate-binding protein PstS [Sinobacterium norvegicum]|uniref:Phosphate-binding protein PstS n=1 Tax=Sinobacterium norvegicum TaxID=1641715 RepID=A0ABM9ACX0_9GAMM|nr:phosphate ABC transporter substrate-binding protein PstS [Sinobacterium norvegicum]CAH0991037.1 Phosphate-binding protein PstS [Sinobacterium norvegicum]
MTITKKFLKPAIISLACTVSLVAATTATAADKFVGSGSSFIYPLMSTWAKTYSDQHDIQIDYQSKGSGAGVRDLISGVVNFAVSDAAMNEKEEAKLAGGAVYLPVTAGEIVVSYNLNGVGELKLSRSTLVDIFMGKISRWDDAAIAADNQGVALPDQRITVVTRSDGSGSTFAFTNHLSAVSPEWNDAVGTGKSVQWAAKSNFVAAPRNDGVAATIMQTPGAIGYIEYGYAVVTKQPMAALENAAGKFVAPGPETGAAALANVQWPENLVAFAADPQGDNAYPITTFTWMMLPQQSNNPEGAAVLRDFVEYILTDGQQVAEQMGYIPVPENLKQLMRESVKQAQ